MNEKSSSNMSNNSALVFVNGVVDPISVLHVDDEEIFLQATKIFLEKTTGGKIQVDSLINPEQVFGKLEKKKYDVIVADYIMPSMNGLQLLERLRNQNNDVPYIILTGRGREEMVIKALNLGANRYIKKGMDTESQFSELIHAIEEVVHHKRTYEALQESEKKYRSRIDNLSEIVVEADIEGVFRYVSPQVFDILGYKSEELIGKSCFDHIHPDDIKRAKEIVEKALTGKSIFDFEHRKKHKDGHYIWVSCSIRCDKENRLVFVMKDITESKQLQKKIQQERQQFERAINSLDHPFYVIDANDYTIQLMNTATKKIFGEFTQPITCYKLTHNENKPCSGKDHQCPMIEVIKTKKSCTTEHQHLDVDGRVRTFDLRSHPIFDQEGNVIQVIEYTLDITDRKKIEEELRESKELYQDLYENAPDMYASVDLRTTTIIRCNQTLATYLGYTKEEIIGKPVFMIYHPDCVEDAKKTFQSFKKNGKVHDIELQLKRKDGSKINVSLNVSAVHDEQGDILYSRSALRDITKQKQAENALRESEERLKAFLEAATDSILLFDSDLNFITLNKAAEKEIGLPREKILGKQYLEVLPHLKGTKRYEAYKEVIGTGKPFLVETLKIPRFGDKNFSIRAFKVGDGLGMIILDITERKQVQNELQESEERYRSFVQNFLGIAYRGNMDFTPIFFHGRVEEITGYSEYEFVAGKPRWDQIIHQDDLPPILEEVKTVKSTPKYSNKFEYRIIRKDGQVRWVDELIQNICDDSGKPISVQGTIYDITERKKAEEALRESEIRYRKLFEESPVSLWEEDFSQVFSYLTSLKESGIEDFRKYFTEHPEYVSKCASIVKILDVNQATLGLYKAKSKDEIIENLNRVFVEESYDTFREELIALAEGATKFSIETTGQNLKGEKIYVDLGLSISTGYGDPSSRVLISILDVTKRKQAEEALRESEERLRAFIYSSTHAIDLWDSDLNLIDCNQAVINYFSEGTTKENLIGKNITEIIPDIKETGRYDKYIEVLKTGKPYNLESFVSHPKFGDKIFSVQAVKVGDGLGMITSDITERKKAEEALRESEGRFRLLGENIEVGLSVVQGDQLIYGNNSFFEITGFPKEEILGTVIYEFNKEQVHPDDLAFVQEQLKKKISGEKDGLVARYQYRWYTKNNLLKWIEVISKPVVFQGKPAILGAILDITKQKQTENEILLVNKELQDFASIVAHDLKAPLRNMKTIVDWFLRDFADDLNEEGKEYLSTVIKLTTHMDKLIDGVYRYSKIDRFHKEISKINLKALLSEIIDVLNPPDNIKINIQAELPILAVDRTHITQIFSNLIDNAIKFMDKPKGHININCEDKKDLWQFSVADNGPGVEESHFERIFQIFQTLSSRDEAKGTGLGLAIVKKIVEMNEGKIWLESTVGEGSTFYFTLSKG